MSAVLVLSGSSLALSMRRPYQFSYQVKDLQQGLDFAAEQISNGHQVTGEYQVLLPGTFSSPSGSFLHLKR